MLRLLRQLAFVSAIVIGGVYAFMALRGPHGVPRMMETRHELQKMESENEKLRQEIRAREEHLRRLEDSQEEREKAIRERTNKQKPDETTIYLPDADQAH